MRDESYGDFVDRLFKRVRDHMGWDDEKTNLWFLTENPFFGNLTPNSYLALRLDKIERVIEAMIEEDT